MCATLNDPRGGYKNGEALVIGTRRTGQHDLFCSIGHSVSKGDGRSVGDVTCAITAVHCSGRSLFARNVSVAGTTGAAG